MTLKNCEADETRDVEELRHRLKGIMSPELYNDTSMFIKFLRARNYDLTEAEKMLTNHINWRNIHRVDSILSWYTPNEVCSKYIGFGPVGFDKEGDLLFYLDFGLDLRGVLSSITLSELTKHVIFVHEEIMKIMKTQSKKVGKKMDRWTYILNFDKITLSTVTHKGCVEAAMKMLSLYEANYPEMLKNALLVNTSWVFQIGFAIIKPLLSGTTLKKVTVYGKDGWKEELLKFVDDDELPVFLGGNKVNHDERFPRATILQPEKVPESYYAVNNNNFSNQAGVKKLVVNRLSKQRVEFNVLHTDSNVEWEFQTKDRDIDVSLHYKNDTEEKALMPKQRYDTSKFPEFGFFKCHKPGVYYLEFDNTYSWIHQKEVYYKLEVLKPHIEDNTA